MSPSNAPDDVHFRIPRGVWWGTVVVPTIGFLIWLAFHLYGQLLAIQTELGTKRADCAHIEDTKSTCILRLDEDGRASCVFRGTKLKSSPP